MKKILVVLVMLLSLVGCATTQQPSAIDKSLETYKQSLTQMMNNPNLSTEEKMLWLSVMSENYQKGLDSARQSLGPPPATNNFPSLIIPYGNGYLLF